MEEDAALYAVKYATLKLGKECVTPREVSQYILPEARVGVNEPWEAAKDTMEQLERSHYLEKCGPIVEVAGYQGYKLAKTAEERITNLGEADKPFPPSIPTIVEYVLEEHERREKERQIEETKRTRPQRAVKWLVENAASALIAILIGIVVGILLAVYGLKLG